MVVSIFVSNIAIQIGIFTISSTLLLFCTRPFVKKITKNDIVATNAYSIVGKKGIVIKQIDQIKGNGQVKVAGEIWTATTEDHDIIAEGEHIIVLKIDGVKAIVKKATSNEEKIEKQTKEKTNV